MKRRPRINYTAQQRALIQEYNCLNECSLWSIKVSFYNLIFTKIKQNY